MAATGHPHGRAVAMAVAVAVLAAAARLASSDRAAPTSSGPGRWPRGMHSILSSYPGVRLLHRDPDVFAVDDFFSVQECAILLSLGRESDKLRRDEVVGDADCADCDHYRTSSSRLVFSTQIPPETPAKIEKLLMASRTRLEHMKVLHYQQGEYYKPHTDGSTGGSSHSGFENSTRLATLFVYLNDVEQGGETAFPQLDLSIKPRAGMAVVHFPTSYDKVGDDRTEHTSLPVLKGEKFLFVTWLWRDPRTRRVVLDSDGGVLGTLPMGA